MALELEFISETGEEAARYAATFRAALRFMQVQQGKRVRILCARCGNPLIAWNQKHVTEGRLCSFCIEVARLVVLADRAGILG